MFITPQCRLTPARLLSELTYAITLPFNAFIEIIYIMRPFGKHYFRAVTAGTSALPPPLKLPARKPENGNGAAGSQQIPPGPSMDKEAEYAHG